jgi:hypothetical protein
LTDLFIGCKPVGVQISSAAPLILRPPGYTRTKTRICLTRSATWRRWTWPGTISFFRPSPSGVHDGIFQRAVVNVISAGVKGHHLTAACSDISYDKGYFFTHLTSRFLLNNVSKQYSFLPFRWRRSSRSDVKRRRRQ